MDKKKKARIIFEKSRFTEPNDTQKLTKLEEMYFLLHDTVRTADFLMAEALEISDEGSSVHWLVSEALNTLQWGIHECMNIYIRETADDKDIE